MCQKWGYNIIRFFQKGCNVGVITFGGGVDVSFAKFKQFEDTNSLQTFFTGIRYRGSPGRRAGLALTSALKFLRGAPQGTKKLVYMLSMGSSADDVKGPVNQLKGAGATVFVHLVGPAAKPADAKLISPYYVVTKLFKEIYKVIYQLYRATLPGRLECFIKYQQKCMHTITYNLFTQRMQSLGFYSRLLGPVSDHVLINRASKERAFHRVILYSSGTIC